MCVCLSEFICTTCIWMPRGQKKQDLQVVVCAGNWTQVLFRCNKCSYHLSQLSSSLRSFWLLSESILKTGVFTSEQITYSMPTEPLSCAKCSWTSISASLLLLIPPTKAHTQVRRRWGKAVSVYEYLKEFLIIEREGEAFFLNIKFKK